MIQYPNRFEHQQMSAREVRIARWVYYECAQFARARSDRFGRVSVGAVADCIADRIEERMRQLGKT